MIFFFFLQVESFLLQQLGLVGSSNCLMGISKPPELLPVPSYILASWSFLVEFFFCRLLLLFPILEFLPFKLFQFRCSWMDLSQDFVEILLLKTTTFLSPCLIVFSLTCNFGGYICKKYLAAAASSIFFLIIWTVLKLLQLISCSFQMNFIAISMKL